MQELKIDMELEMLLPKLEEEKYNLLKDDILKNGCINPIIVWNGFIVDGHHRYKICRENNIEFNIKQMVFENKEEAMIWAWTTQKGRRNIDDGTLFNIAKVFKPYYEKKAKENQKTSTGGANPQLCMKSDKAEKIDTTKELAKIAGTGRDTMNKVIQIQKKAPESVNKAVENNVISINKGYEITKKIKDLPKEKKEEEAERLLDEQFKQECKELDKAHRIYCKINDAVYKPISVEITEENVGYWLEDMTQEELLQEENNINEGINNLKEIRRILQGYKMIRRVK